MHDEDEDVRECLAAYGAFERVPFRPPLEDLDRPFGPPPLWLEIAGLALFMGGVLALATRTRSAPRTRVSA